jgi:hypothetical protein
MKFVILGVTAVVAFAAMPAMAKKARYGQSIYCATREQGNPYSRLCDYQGWVQWRRQGGWDSRLDNACVADPLYKPPGCERPYSLMGR